MVRVGGIMNEFCNEITYFKRQMCNWPEIYIVVFLFFLTEIEVLHTKFIDNY